MDFYHNISNLNLQITGWHIRVKVLRSFRIYVDDSMGLILSNEEGVRIEAMVDKQFARYYIEFISEGEWLTITKFGVRVNLDEFKATKQFYKIVFLEDTVVKKSAYIPVAGNINNNFESFASITQGWFDTTILVDLVGAIIEVGPLKITSNNSQDVAGFDFPFKMKDKDENVLECMAVNKEALDFERNYRMCGGGVIIVALRWWKVIRYPERPYNRMISTSGGISKVDVNPNIPVVEDIREMSQIVIQQTYALTIALFFYLIFGYFGFRLARTAIVNVEEARRSS